MDSETSETMSRVSHAAAIGGVSGTFDNYQRESQQTAIYPHQGRNLLYPVLGLLSEAGEIADRMKRVIRDEGGDVSATRRSELKAELGDVLWYLSQVATELELSLQEIAEGNLLKLAERQQRGTLRHHGADQLAV